MKTLFAIACGMLVAFSAASAPRDTVHRDTELFTDSFSSKQEALDAGFNMYESLETASDSQLRWKLNTAGDDVIGGSMTIESAKVRIEEFPISRDQVQYRAVIDVDYSYKKLEDR